MTDGEAGEIEFGTAKVGVHPTGTPNCRLPVDALRYLNVEPDDRLEFIKGPGEIVVAYPEGSDLSEEIQKWVTESDLGVDGQKNGAVQESANTAEDVVSDD